MFASAQMQISLEKSQKKPQAAHLPRLPGLGWCRSSGLLPHSATGACASHAPNSRGSGLRKNANEDTRVSRPNSALASLSTDATVLQEQACGHMARQQHCGKGSSQPAQTTHNSMQQGGDAYKFRSELQMHRRCLATRSPATVRPLPTPAPSPMKKPALLPSGSSCWCRWQAYTTLSSCSALSELSSWSCACRGDEQSKACQSEYCGREAGS